MIKKLVRFWIDGVSRYGIMDEGEVESRVSELGGNLLNYFDNFHLTGREYKTGQVRLLSPCLPSKIVGIGLNYHDHAKELNLPEPGEPLMFLKPSTALIGPGDEIVYPKMSREVHYEAELGVVVGKVAKGVSPEEAEGYILGYTCVNDVTARDLQNKDGQWTRAKSFDTFASVGPCLAIGLDPSCLAVQSYLNGKLRQSSNTEQLIFNPFVLLSFVSQVMTLLPGDLISTGTPVGVGSMQPGDVIEVEIEGIGRLVNKVVSFAGGN